MRVQQRELRGDWWLILWRPSWSRLAAVVTLPISSLTIIGIEMVGKTLLKMQKNEEALPDSFQAKVLDYLVLYQGP